MRSKSIECNKLSFEMSDLHLDTIINYVNDLLKHKFNKA